MRLILESLPRRKHSKYSHRVLGFGKASFVDWAVNRFSEK